MDSDLSQKKPKINHRYASILWPPDFSHTSYTSSMQCPGAWISSAFSLCVSLVLSVKQRKQHVRAAKVLPMIRANRYFLSSIPVMTYCIHQIHHLMMLVFRLHFYHFFMFPSLLTEWFTFFVGNSGSLWQPTNIPCLLSGFNI